ncbi:hypothetical protein [Brachyspira sp.]|uniref:hypothetical protein n=1 Tax=Brachyspira sp. TaxID=1977261 RepID=UPI003D7F1607
MYKGRNIYLCGFANIELALSIVRFHNQAKESNFFDNIFIYNEYNLPKDEKFESLLSHKLVPSRGFGYWCWKPFVILKTLENIKDGDILVYADIGCHINKEGEKRFNEYLDIVIEHKALCFKLSYLERYWTKADLFNYFDKLNDKNITDTPQRPSGFFICEKNNINLEFVNKWLQVYYDDFSLIDDTPSKIPNLDGFVENRHDQSVFSILSKIYNFYTIDECEFENNIKHFPFNASRDKRSIFNLYIDKIVWWIPNRKKRDYIRNIYEQYCRNILLDIIDNKQTKINSHNPIDFIIKLYLRNKINSFIRNRKEIGNIINKISDYKKEIRF